MFENNLDLCFRGAPPPCVTACPFGLDIRAFADKAAKGNFNAALKLYRNAVAFPNIVARLCPAFCREACLRAAADAPVALAELERACANLAGKKDPPDYHLPPKAERVAVVGGGMSGLACAIRLAEKSYQVSVYEKTSRPGGQARRLAGEAIFTQEFAREFQFIRYQLLLEQEIKDLGGLAADAVYIATGKGGRDFGLLPLPDPSAPRTRLPQVFLGGELTGADPVTAIAQGLQAAGAIQAFLRGGGAPAQSEPKANPFPFPLEIKPLPPVIPEAADYTSEEAQAEAARCLKCDCDNCLRHCDLMTYYQRYPLKIKNEVFATFEPDSFSPKGALRLINSCTACGNCLKACPADVAMEDFFLQSRRRLRQLDLMPGPFHDFWLRDMAFATGDLCHLAQRPPGLKKSAFAFFPGCQLGASDPEYVLRSYAWLRERQPDTALWLSCCAAPAEWAGEEGLLRQQLETLEQEWAGLGRPQVIFACATCQKMFAKYLPGIKGLSLYTLMAAWGIAGPAQAEPEALAVFDPCSAKDDPELRQSVRQLAADAGYVPEELPDSGEIGRCCGWGGHSAVAAPAFAADVIQKRIAESPLPYLTYCANCRDLFAKSGKSCYHLLDLLFALNGKSRPAPGIDQRRENRFLLKQRALREYFGLDGAAGATYPGAGVALTIPADLAEQMDRDLILREDIWQTIAHCEKSGRKAIRRDNGHCVGNLAIGPITYWAEYEKTADAYMLHAAYCHRLRLPR